MSTRNAKRVARAYAETLRRHHFPFSSVYLFGSHATGRARAESDIDVAVVVSRIGSGNAYLNGKMQLRRFVLEVDPSIEPTLIEQRDLRQGITPMAYAVREHGIRIV